MRELPYVRQLVNFSAPARYQYEPDSAPHPGVPRGTVREHELPESRVFPGTTRRFWVYVPARYDPARLASLMVFQDGWMYLDPDGDVRAGVVFDNLIHRGEIPSTVGVFVDPGVPGNRNVEYDAFSERYDEFLLTEILPTVRRDLQITDDPDRWAICGGSSGGSCALTAAWIRPDRFRRVLSFLGSFAQLEGGNRYPEFDPRDTRQAAARLSAGGHARPQLGRAEDELVLRQPAGRGGASRARLRPTIRAR